MKPESDRIRDFILSEFLPGESPANLKDDTPLRTSGILDSVATLRVVTFVEQTFGIEVEAHEAGVDNFDRIEDIVHFIERKLSGEKLMPVCNLAEILESSAARFADRLAVSDCHGASCTYAELNDRASRVAGFLAARGIHPGDRVGILMPKTVDAVAVIFGILKAGATYVPADPTAPRDRVQSIFDDCRVSIIIDDAGPAQSHEPLRESRPVALDDLAYILYTSGSTGVPKGVMLSHGNALSFLDWCSSEFQPVVDDRFSSHAPFHFDLSVLDIYLPLIHGASLFLISGELGKNPKALARYIADQRLTVWYSTPSILSLLADFGGLDRSDCSSLRLVLFAGEVFPVKHLRKTTRLWPAPAYYNLYGPTETNVCTFVRIPTPIPDDRTEPYPIGHTCSHCSPLVLADDGSPGAEGLLHISGPSVFQGYWNRPGENAAAFTERNGVRWYNTGDVVREDGANGFVYLGRRDRMVKRRGYRIELGDIESALYRHDSIREAAVVSLADGESGLRIVAHLVASPEGAPSIIDMKTFCAGRLPAYMSPDIFVFTDALPKTSTGKVDYNKLSLPGQTR